MFTLLLNSDLASKATSIHFHDDRYYMESEINNILTQYSKKISYSEKYASSKEQVITNGTIMDSCEPNIPFNCWLIINYHLTLRSTNAKSRAYWMLEGAYIQGNEGWNGSINKDYTFDKTFVISAKAGQIIQLKMTDTNNVGIISRGDNSSLNLFRTLCIPR